VIGHGERRHIELGAPLHVAVDFGTAVEQRIVGMTMQMNEWFLFGIGHVFDYLEVRRVLQVVILWGDKDIEYSGIYASYGGRDS